jgi:hypothetical protein
LYLTLFFISQKYYYRYSKSRAKAEYFEGRDDSGVVSQRFIKQPLGNQEFREFYSRSDIPTSDQSQYNRLLQNCLALGSSNRPDTSAGSLWHSWFGSSSTAAADRCRLLFVMNTVGAGRGTTMLWETNPPPIHAEGPEPWLSEQETAADKIKRQLLEINALCETGLVAARVQMLVCEPIPDVWTEWMDSLLPSCGGKVWPHDRPLEAPQKLEQRPSPVQIVVAGSPKTADTCHDLKSGFMEQRMQDLVLASHKKDGSKSTHPDLVSTDDHDLYIASKWSNLITIRSVHAFLQASADLAAAAASPDVSSLVDGPSSPFLVPSFVRVAYVSEENSKVAKWRMHGDFFHPAAWEICRDSFDMTWIPHSLAGAGGVSGLCYEQAAQLKTTRQLQETSECGQWWLYFTELQMPLSPEIYANEQVPAPVAGGSNFVWMVTERQRIEMVQGRECRAASKSSCPPEPQGVIPLGDLESFLINYMPNTALGKKHVEGRRPGYTHEEERQKELELVRERKQLKDQEDIEKALFDYTIYPAALMHKDATLKAARSRDKALTPKASGLGPQTIKSSYYDVTIVKPRSPLLGWCQAIARNGLCTLYADYFRTSTDLRCQEACGMKRDFTKITK